MIPTCRRPDWGWSVLARYSRTCFSGAFSATSCWPCAVATAALNLSWTSRFTAREGKSMARNKVLRPGSARGATTASVTETARPKNARKSISYPSLSAWRAWWRDHWRIVRRYIWRRTRAHRRGKDLVNHYWCNSNRGWDFYHWRERIDGANYTG